MATHSIILPGKFHGERSLANYSPSSYKDSDMTEQHYFFLMNITQCLGSQFPQMVKVSAYNEGDPGFNPGSGRSSGEEIATNSSTLAWKTPRTEEPGRLQSMGSQ